MVEECSPAMRCTDVSYFTFFHYKDFDNITVLISI